MGAGNVGAMRWQNLFGVVGTTTNTKGDPTMMEVRQRTEGEGKIVHRHGDLAPLTQAPTAEVAPTSSHTPTAPTKQ